jgi:hypothetical protein
VYAFAFIVALCCPILLGPVVMPFAKMRLKRKTLRRLYGDAGRLPDGMSLEPTTFGMRRLSHLWCDLRVVEILTTRGCGGRIHQVRETLEHESGDVFLCCSIARVCLVCGRLEKTGHPSRILGSAFARVTDAASLGAAILGIKAQESALQAA